MRQFYIFNISNEFKYNIKLDDYVLYKVFEELHNMNEEEIKYAMNIYNNIINPLNKNIISNKIYNKFKNDENYSKFMNKHLFNSYFKKENSTLIINNSYMELDTSSARSSFINYLKKYKNLFVCDFDNKDYFWLESIA